MKIKKYIAQIVENGKEDEMHELSNMLDNLICDLKEKNPMLYKEYKMQLYDLAYNGKIDEEMATEWVESMRPYGMHWTMQDTTNAMNRLGYECDPVEYFVVANMMFNDYYEEVKSNEELALRMAYDFLDDEDAVDDKLIKYAFYIKRD